MPINPSLFAHILNDAELSGTLDLAGNTFINTVSYLKGFVTEKYPEHVRYGELLRDLEFLMKYDTLITASDADSTHLAHIINDDISHLPPGKKLFVPGGWIGNFAHALIYEIEKKENH